MSRQIKFRAWHEGRKAWLHDGKPPSGGCHILGETILLGGWMYQLSLEELDHVVVEQFTGLVDSKAREIWEGDIVSVAGWQHKGQIRWHHSGFRAAYSWPEKGETKWGGIDLTYFAGDTMDTLEVIGNLHDNPELLA